MKFTIKTIGCKVNTYESNKIKTELIGLGLEYVDLSNKKEYANIDLYIINTCSVTSIADKKSRQMINQAKNNCRNAVIVATGCFVESDARCTPRALCHNHDISSPESEIVFVNNSDKMNLVKILLQKNIIKSINTNDKKNQYTNKSNIREFVKIQDGCNQYCTYCIIPYLRGSIKSRDEKEILTEVENKISNGTKEIVLTGIHLSSYGLDRENMSYESDGAIEKSRIHLLNLISKIAELPVERIRLGSLEPRIINEEFLRKLSYGNLKEKFCPNFCLSLQSGCNKILKSMNRHYTKEQYEESCNLIRKIIPNALITTDIIVGFPGETEDDFNETLAFAKKIRFYNPNIFPYSRRQGTKADKFPNQLTKEIKHTRAITLISECEKITKEIEEEYNKTKHDILIEEEETYDGIKYGVGYTKEYVRGRVKI